MYKDSKLYAVTVGPTAQETANINRYMYTLHSLLGVHTDKAPVKLTPVI